MLYHEETLQISTQADDSYIQHKTCELGSKNILLFYFMFDLLAITKVLRHRNNIKCPKICNKWIDLLECHDASCKKEDDLVIGQKSFRGGGAI